MIVVSAFALAAGGAALAKNTAVATLDVALGESGLSFRYVEQLGETQVPFLADTDHLVQPNGLFIDVDDNVYITEEYGSRLLKYDSTGENLLEIGNAGMCTYFCSTWDSAVDLTGNFWVADGDRLVQFDMAGNQLQELGRSDDENYRFDGGVRGLAFDSTGHMFVSHTWQHRIQVYDLSDGTPVYSSTLGVTDVPSNTLGYFNAPHRLAVDSQDRLLVTDRDNNRVQRCAYAVSWTCELMDGEVGSPEGVTVDTDDNVYITDYWSNRVRKCTAPEVCEDQITGTPAGAHDVALDSSGNIFVSYQYDFTVRKYTSTGVEIGIFAGMEGIPYLTDAEHFNHARLEVDDQDNLLIVEEQGHRLLKLDAQGNYLWQFGVPGVQGNDSEHLSWPHGVAVDSQGYVYVADNCRVVIVTASGDFSETFGECGTGQYQFSWPTGIDVADDGTLYVADYHNHRVQVYDKDLVHKDTLGVTGECGDDDEHLCMPIGVAVDVDGNVYVADGGNNRVQKFNAQGDYQMTIGGGWGSDFGQFAWSEDVEVDAEGRIYVADWTNNRVQVFSPEGAFLTSIGGAAGTNSSQFQGVASVAVDSQGNLYAGDWENLRFQVFTPGYPGWQQVNINGFGDRWNVNSAAMEVFEKRLYVGTGNWSEGGATVWRTVDGKTWEQASAPGFSDEDRDQNAAVIDFAVFDDFLYASTGWSGLPGQIWRSPDGFNWEQIEGNGFDDPGNWAIAVFGVFDNQIYVATSGNEGVEIWQSDTGDAEDWTRVIENGNGNSDNQFITDLIEFNGNIYAMIENSADPKTGLQIWQSKDGLTWNTVVEDGFGNPENFQTGGATVFDNMLYVGTHNAQTGAEIWRSEDGMEWEQAASGGLGSVSNRKIENLFPFNGWLYASTGAENGLQIFASPNGDTWNQLVWDGFGNYNAGWTGWTGNGFHGQLYLAASDDGSGVRIWRMSGGSIYIPMVSKH